MRSRMSAWSGRIQDDSKSGWRKTADAYKDLAEEAGLPWAKSADASGKAEGGHSGRFKDRPSGVSLFGQKSDAYKSPYASKTSGNPVINAGLWKGVYGGKTKES